MRNTLNKAIEQVQNAAYIEPYIKEIIEESLEKQIPKQWAYDRPNHWSCPSCGTMMGISVKFYNYCYNCGQRVFIGEA